MCEGADHVGEGGEKRKESTKNLHKENKDGFKRLSDTTTQDFAKEKGGRGIKNRSREGTMDGKREEKA